MCHWPSDVSFHLWCRKATHNLWLELINLQSDAAALKQRLISMKPVELFGCLSESKYSTLKNFRWKMLWVSAPLSFLTKSDQVTDDRQSSHCIWQPTASMGSIVIISSSTRRHLVSSGTIHVHFGKVSDFKLVKKYLGYRIVLVPAHQNTRNQTH